MTSRQNIVPADAAKFTIVVAVNNDLVLKDSLLRSPEVCATKEIIIRRGCPSAAHAYNSGMREAKSETVVFAHQDVFFPEGWFKSVAKTIAGISAKDPQWGVLGVYGVSRSGEGIGHLYSTGLQRVLGRSFEEPVEVCTLDEVVLIVRRSAALQFDETLPGFHLYGTDICLEARRKGLKCYAVSAFCIHNSNGLAMLPLGYSKAFLYMRRKWRTQLPIFTPCMVITRWGMPLARHYLESLAGLASQRRVGCRCPDPSLLYRQLLDSNQLEKRADQSYSPTCVIDSVLAQRSAPLGQG